MWRTGRSLKKSTADHAEPVRASMMPAVIDGIRKLALSDTERELGGILLGTYHNTQRADVKVEAFIQALYTDASQASLTFTHQSWEQMNNERETRYPHLKVVGWFHTHPGFGVFLSSHDLFIHQNFFDLTWQIAYVVDPIGDYSGMFGWLGGKIEPMPLEVDGVLIPAVTVAHANLIIKPLAGRRTRIIIIILLMGLILSAGLGFKQYRQMYADNYLQPYSGQELWKHPPTMSELIQITYEMVGELAARLKEAVTSDSAANHSKQDK